MAALSIAQRQRLRLSRRQSILVARAHEEERAWVASELHDDILQRIAVARQEIEMIWSPTERHSSDALESRLRGINAELVDLAVAVRGIAARIHPTVVDQVGLPTALRGLVDELGRDGTVDVTLTCDESTPGLGPEVARAAYRIVQEALRNAVRHSEGTSVRVKVQRESDWLAVRVEDNGRGFDAAAVMSRSLGLAGLQERATGVGGKTTIESSPTRGTSIEALLPWPDPVS